MRIVLDTNVVLDWLVFADVGTAELQQAVTDGRVEIITHRSAVEELRRVLAYPQCGLGLQEQQVILERYRSLTSSAIVPEGFGRENLQLPSGFPRCRDRDDEHFIALAYHVHADALVSRDHAVLELVKRAGKFGVTILCPVQLAEVLRVIAPPL